MISLGDPKLAEFAARLGMSFGFEVAGNLATVQDVAARKAVIKAARKLVHETGRFIERSFRQTLDAALATPPGGVVKPKIILRDDEVVEMEPHDV